MASLLSTGRQIKGSAMAGLGSAARSEAQTNIAEEQLEQAKKAQQAQLLGTGLGIGGAYMITQGAGKAAASEAARQAAIQKAQETAATMSLQTGAGVSEAIAAEKAATAATAAAEGGAAASAGGATALLTNPMTWAVVAGLYVLKNIFD